MNDIVGAWSYLFKGFHLGKIYNLKTFPLDNIYISCPQSRLSVRIYEDGHDILCGAISYREATLVERCDQTPSELICQT